MNNRARVVLRRLRDEDLPTLHRWLNEPGVVRWWEGDDVSWDAVVRDYRSEPDDTTEHWIAAVDGHDVAWIQCYAVAAAAAAGDAEAAAVLTVGVDDGAAGIDYLIGEPSLRGRGIGGAVISAFVAEVVFGPQHDYTQAFAAPYAANIPSWRALEKAGFRFLGSFDDDDGPCRVMVIERGDGRHGA